MNYVTRSQWGARAPNGTGNAISSSPKGHAIHWEGPHMGSQPHSSCDDTVRGIQAYHMDTQGWSDIAYSLMVCAHGYVYEGRGKGKGSAANGTTQANYDWYAICALVGEGDAQPAELIAGLQDAADTVRSWGAANGSTGHRDHISTACPGDALYSQVRAGTFLAGASVAPGPPGYTESEAPMILVYGRSPYLLSGGRLAAISSADRDRLTAAGVPVAGIDNATWPGLAAVFSANNDGAFYSKQVWERYSPGGQNLATWLGDIGQNVDWLVQALQQVAAVTGTSVGAPPTPVADAGDTQDEDGPGDYSGAEPGEDEQS